MAKETAVEWFLKEIIKNARRDWKDTNVYELAEQAKQMEKEQIKDAIIHNQNGLLRRKTVLEAEQYYNETYNK